MNFADYLTQLAGQLGEEEDQLIDWHCHLLPGIDDGPKTLEASLQLAQQLVDNGVRKVIATPHLLHPSFENINPSLVKQKFDQLSEAIAQLPLEIFQGGEVRIDSRLYENEQCLHDCLIGDKKKYLLLELPTDIAVDPSALIKSLAGKGIKVIVAHVERYNWLFSGKHIWQDWLQSGAMLQINTDSFLSDELMDRVSELMVFSSWVMVASDSHGGRRIPKWPETFQAITDRWGESVAYEVVMTNPNMLYKRAFGAL